MSFDAAAAAPPRPADASVPPIDMDIVNNNNTGIKNSVEVPSTPLGADAMIPASQETLLSTEGPGSPMDADESFRTELNDDVDAADLRRVIPSSLTPPPSSQVQPQANHHQQQHQPQFLQPPNSQPTAPTHSINSYVNASSQRSSAILSPPGTGPNAATNARREAAAAAAAAAATMAGSEFVPPSPSRIAEATPDELRAMLQASLAEHTRLKTETAHHKLQYSLLSLQADEDAKRAAVEHEMTRREVEALRQAESVRQARRELSSVTNNAISAAPKDTDETQSKYRQLKAWYDELVVENEKLERRVKSAKRVIQQKEEEVAGLVDEKELLLNRLRENREHFHLLCSPGGLFHGAMTPKPQASSPVHARTTPYQTPKSKTTGGGRLGKDAPHTVGGGSSSRSGLLDRDHGAEPIAALLQALSQQENSNHSAPSTPVAGHRAPPRQHHPAKHHVRNVQSLSSLPTTPTSRPRGDYAGGLLPSVDLVPQTEPPPLRFTGPSGGSGRSGHGHSLSTSASGRYFPETPTRQRRRLPDHQPERGRRSRESTISADEETGGRGSSSSNNNTQPDNRGNLSAGGSNEDLARQALESVAARAATTSFSSHLSSRSHSQSQSSRHNRPDEEVFDSPASQAASAMLRRDPRESFEIAGSAGPSRDGTPSAGQAQPTTASSTTEKSAKLQAKLFGGLNKASSGNSIDKRKFSGGMGDGQHGAPYPSHTSSGAVGRDDLEASPTKKVRIVPSLRDAGDSSYRHHHSSSHYQQGLPQQSQQSQQQQQQQQQQRVGLGIQYH